MASAASVPKTSHNAGLSLLRRRQTSSKTRREGESQQNTAEARDSGLDSPAGFIMTDVSRLTASRQLQFQY